MTFNEFRHFIAPLALHFGAVKDEQTWRLYHGALMTDPAPSKVLLERARVRAANRRYFPRTWELREDCEIERMALIASHPYQHCSQCRHNVGWITVREGEIERVMRCGCRQAHIDSLMRQGVGTQPIARIGEGAPREEEIV